MPSEGEARRQDAEACKFLNDHFFCIFDEYNQKRFKYSKICLKIVFE
jgi:hypothetical protein